MLLYCAHKQEKVDKIIEEGVKIVLNHIEPYQIPGEPTTSNIEEIFTIDTEYLSIARTGLTDISCFDVDSKVIDKIIDHLKLTFMAERPPPPQRVQQELLMAAEEREEYF